MGYTNVLWYRDGIKGWKAAQNFVESSDYTYRTRKIPKPVSPDSLKAQIEKESSAVVLIDIRDEASRKKLGLIDAPSIHIPLYSLAEDYENLPRDKKLVFCDIRGKQAASAIRFLLNKQFAFTRLSWLEEGISGWIDKGYSVKREK